MLIDKSSFQTGIASSDTFSVREDLAKGLRTSKEYRHAFVEETIRSGLSAQIRAMRERMPDMTQKKFGELLGNKSQSWVARLEDPNETVPTLSTLLRVAKACDVALQVRFTPFSEFADWVSGVAHWVLGLSSETMVPPDFKRDPGLLDRKQPQSDIAASRYVLLERWSVESNTEFRTSKIEETGCRTVGEIGTIQRATEPAYPHIRPFESDQTPSIAIEPLRRSA